MKKIANALLMVFIISILVGGFTNQVAAETLKEISDGTELLVEESIPSNFRISQFIEENEVVIEDIAIDEDNRDGIIFYIKGFYNRGEFKESIDLSDISYDILEGKDIANIDGNSLIVKGEGKIVIEFTPKDELLASQLGSTEITIVSSILPVQLDDGGKLQLQEATLEDYNFRVMQFDGRPNSGKLSDFPSEVTMSKRGDGHWNTSVFRVWGYYDEGGKVVPVQLEDCQEITGDIYTDGMGNIKPIVSHGGMTLNVYVPGDATMTFRPKDAVLAEKLGTVTYTIKAIDPDAPKEEFSVNITEKPSNIKAGEDLNVKATASNGGLEAKNALLIVGLYDKNNTMVNYSYAEKEVLAGQSVNLGAGLKLPENSSGYKVKIFLWDNWANRNAISDVTEIDVK